MIKSRVMSIKSNVPNFLTICNLICGVVSVTLVLEGNIVLAAVFIFIAGVFDYLDGTSAKLLNARSLLGKELDSLSDVVSFGVAPGIIIYQLLSVPCAGSSNILERMHIIPYFAILIPVCSAIRLAKFNLDIRQEENFIGLPTPGNAMFFASIPLIILLQPRVFSIIPLDFMVTFFSNTRVLTILTVFFSYLLISELRLFSMKFKTMDWKSNQVRYIFLIISVLLLLLFSISAIPLIIVAYIFLSLGFQRNI
jgi:CDP-diacylglycerol---serine O-phosphatidyltransferase